MTNATMTVEPTRTSECETALQETALQREAPPQPRAHVVKGLTLSDARDLLDWLEAHGIEQFEVDLDDGDMICVSWID